MAIERLGVDDLANFLQKSAAPDALWFFLHIPKTAGSSLSAELNEIRSPYRNIHLSDDDYRRTDLHGEAFWSLADPYIDEMLAAHGTVGYRSASGHMLAPQAQRLVAAIPGTRIFTFLRNPVARVISDYRYQRSDQHPAYATFSAEYPTIESYLPSSDANKMYRHLCIDPNEPVNDLVSRVQSSFDFVGIVEMYPLSFNLLTRLFGENRMPSHHERAASPENVSAVEVTDSLRARIADLNALDLRIYDHFHHLLLPHREAWQEMLRAEQVSSGRLEDTAR